MHSIAKEKGQAHQRPALRIADTKDNQFTCHRQAALALLNSDGDLTWRAGQFLGGLAVSEDTLSEKQAAWLGKLLERAGLPSLATGGANV